MFSRTFKDYNSTFLSPVMTWKMAFVSDEKKNGGRLKKSLKPDGSILARDWNQPFCRLARRRAALVEVRRNCGNGNVCGAIMVRSPVVPHRRGHVFRPVLPGHWHVPPCAKIPTKNETLYKKVTQNPFFFSLLIQQKRMSSLPPTLEEPAPKMVYVPRVDRSDHDTKPSTLLNNIDTTFCNIKEACEGVAYDYAHYDSIPGHTVLEKVQIMCTRGGRLPYLVLLVAISFASFFLFVQIGRTLFGPAHPRAAAVTETLMTSRIPMVGPRMAPASSYKIV